MGTIISMSDVPVKGPTGESREGEVIAPPVQVLALAPEVVPVSAERMAANERFAVRVWCTFVFTMCAGMLGMGLWLTPSVKGAGTHEQLGLPPCLFFERTGVPCMTCGCTTAVAHFAHGHVVASLLTQPFGFALALLAALLVPLTVVGMWSGRWFGPSMFKIGWYWRWWVFGGTGLLLLAWGYKVLMVRAGRG